MLLENDNQLVIKDGTLPKKGLQLTLKVPLLVLMLLCFGNLLAPGERGRWEGGRERQRERGREGMN